MQTQKLVLPVVKYDEFSGHTKKLVATVRASDLRKLHFPLNANVRKPTRNYVVNSILESIKTKQGTMLIDAPIFIACHSARVMAAADRPSMYYVEMEFHEMHGVLDGGHRLEAIRLANIDRGEYDTDNVMLTFQINPGLAHDAIVEKAIALNTSKNPSTYEMANARGKFDWLKECLADTEFKYVQYYSGQLEGGFDGDSFCLVTSLLALPQAIDPRYDPKALGSLPRNRHPMYLSSPTGANTGNSLVHIIEARKKQSSEQSDLFPDILRLYCHIMRLLDSQSARAPLAFISSVKDTRKATHLPDGTILQQKHPAKLYIIPIISCFRLLMKEQMAGWKVNPIEDISSTTTLVRALISEYRYIMQRGDRVNSGTSIIYKDAYTWDRLYARAEKELEKGRIFKELQNEIQIAA